MKKTLLILLPLFLLASCNRQTRNTSSDKTPLSQNTPTVEETVSAPEKVTLTLSYDKNLALDGKSVFAIESEVKIHSDVLPEGTKGEVLLSLDEESQKYASLEESTLKFSLTPHAGIVVKGEVKGHPESVTTLSFTSVNPNTYHHSALNKKLRNALAKENSFLSGAEILSRYETEATSYTYSLYQDQVRVRIAEVKDQEKVFQRENVFQYESQEDVLRTYTYQEDQTTLMDFSEKEHPSKKEIQKGSLLSFGEAGSLNDLLLDPQTGYWLGKENLGQDEAKKNLKVTVSDPLSYHLSSAYTAKDIFEENQTYTLSLDLTFSGDDLVGMHFLKKEGTATLSDLSFRFTYKKKTKAPKRISLATYLYTDYTPSLSSPNGKYLLGNTYSLKVEGDGNEMVDPVSIVAIEGKDSEGNDIALLDQGEVKIRHEGSLTVKTVSQRSGIEKTFTVNCSYPAVRMLNITPSLTSDTLEIGSKVSYEAEVLPSSSKQTVKATVSDPDSGKLTKIDDQHFALEILSTAKAGSKLTVTFTTVGLDEEEKPLSQNYTYTIKEKTMVTGLKETLVSHSPIASNSSGYETAKITFNADGSGTLEAYLLIAFTDVTIQFHYDVKDDALILESTEEDESQDFYLTSLSIDNGSIRAVAKGIWSEPETVTFALPS